MSGAIKDGGPAFPKPLDPYPNMQGAERGWHGMSLRDYFAAAALAPIVTSAIAARRSVEEDVAARAAYIMADAMLKAREARS